MAQYLEAVQARQHIIEHGQRVLAGKRTLYSGCTVVNCFDFISVRFKILCYQFAEPISSSITNICGITRLISCKEPHGLPPNFVNVAPMESIFTVIKLVRRRSHSFIHAWKPRKFHNLEV